MVTGWHQVGLPTTRCRVRHRPRGARGRRPGDRATNPGDRFSLDAVLVVVDAPAVQSGRTQRDLPQASRRSCGEQGGRVVGPAPGRRAARPVEDAALPAYLPNGEIAYVLSSN